MKPNDTCRWLVLLLVCVSITSATAQTSLRFRDYVQQVQRDSSVRIYYDHAALDTAMVDITTTRSVRAVLEELLQATPYKWSYDPSGNYFITRQHGIVTTLPHNFFTGTRSTDAAAPSLAHLDKQEVTAKETLKPVVIGSKNKGNGKTAAISGYVKDIQSGEAIIGCAVFIKTPPVGVSTDKFGHYILNLPPGYHEIHFKIMGMKEIIKPVTVWSDGSLSVEMEEEVVSLKEVVINADEVESTVAGLDIGMQKLDIKTIKQIPLVMGEADILKVIMTLPGVQTVGEGTVGLNVRGGTANQNLILFNDAVIYNPSHLFGFFSSFNPDIVKNVNFQKGGIPAEYGGRISSVLSIDTKDGNQKKFSGGGGLSPLTGRLSLEIPVKKDKSSLLVAGRTTYSDWLLKQLPSEALNESQASFYDVSANYTHTISSRATFYLSGYMSNDRFRFNGDTTYQYSNRTLTARYKLALNEKAFTVTTLSYSGYSFSVNSTSNTTNAFRMKYAINQVTLKNDVNFFLPNAIATQAGVAATLYKINPGQITPQGDDSQIETEKLDRESALESALYIDMNKDVTRHLSIGAGLRYSLYGTFGPRTEFRYVSGQPLSENTIRDTVQFGSNRLVSFYHGPELRLRLRYLLPKNASVKLSYNRMRQYLQMLSNTTAISPTDIWKLSDTHIQPQIGDQVSAGYYKLLRQGLFEVSAEAYYKLVKNMLDYKDGATLLLNEHLETDVIQSKGKAYGVEFLLKKTRGKLNGWISYTYSRSFLKSVTRYTEEEVNRGTYYPSSYDKPHSLNVIGNYKFNRRINISTNVVYSTGRPITLPIGRYILNGTERLIYSDRNAYRIPDYFRVDLSVNLEGNHKVRKLAHSSWSFSVYNLTGRRNAYSVFFKSENGVIKGYKLSIFGEPIPTITYNFRF
jgi:hypothetical protein